jgi:hypothetical protein
MIEFKEGDEVRLKNGKTGVVRDINPNPDYKADDEYWAELESPFDTWEPLGEIDDPEDIVEVLRTAAELAAVDIPTLSELRDFVQDGLHSAWGNDGIEVNESEREDTNAITFSGTKDGRPFTAQLEVTWVEGNIW